MDCSTARFLLPFHGRSSGELDPAEAGALEGHLHDCPECRAAAEAERRLDERLGQAMRDVPVPEGLRAALLTKLRGERDAFYRRWLVRGLGAAAAVLLAAWLGWVAWDSHKPEIALQGFRDQGSDQQGLMEAAATQQRVEGWLQKVGGQPLLAPPKFDYGLLIAYYMDEVDGRRVPCLLFVKSDPGGGSAFWARVYVLSDRRFNLEAIRRQLVQQSGPDGLQFELLSPEDNAGVAYAVVYRSAEGLPLFYKRQQPAVGVARFTLPHLLPPVRG